MTSKPTAVVPDASPPPLPTDEERALETLADREWCKRHGWFSKSQDPNVSRGEKCPRCFLRIRERVHQPFFDDLVKGVGAFETALPKTGLFAPSDDDADTE